MDDNRIIPEENGDITADAKSDENVIASNVSGLSDNARVNSESTNKSFYSHSEGKVKKKKLVRTVLIVMYVFILLCAFLVPYIAFRSQKTVSSDITINVSEIDKISKLKVMSITDTQVVTENKDDNSEGITAWTQFTGRGDFVINLQQSEVIVDNVRKTVIVRTPNVSIDQETFTLEYGNTKTYFFNNSVGNDSYREGVDIAHAQMQEAYSKIYDSITRNQHYYQAAEESAWATITSLVRSWNKDISDLHVIVEIGVL